MDAKELQRENQRLKKLLAKSQQDVSELSSQLSSTTATISQHEATIAQFQESVGEKQQTIAALQHQIKLLLQRIKGSRQERINPDQLLLFSLEELEELVRDLTRMWKGIWSTRPPGAVVASRGDGLASCLIICLVKSFVMNWMLPSGRAPAAGRCRRRSRK